MMIMVGLGMAGLWFMNRQRGTQEDQVDQLAGAAMMASGEGTAPDAPFQTYSAPANPVFFFNQGGQMTKVPGTNIPFGASSDEDIGVYPGGRNQPELEFEIARSMPPAGTTDISPTTPEFAGSPDMGLKVTASTVWDQEALIASANFMPLLAIQDTGGGGVKVLGSNVDISTLSSKEAFRAVNLDTGFAFTTSAGVLQEYVQGFTNNRQTSNGPGIVIDQTAPSVPIPILGGSSWIERQEWDLDIGM
jgi:hypothetical protein